MLKLSRYYISSSLADVFNASIKTRIFPADFKLGKVTPIYKTGDKDDPGNYRPISVLPSTSRLFKKVLYNQLYDYFAKNKLLGDGQWGFCSLHSTALALSQCTNDWIINIDRGDMCNAVFLDIKKAFDTMDHEILLKKLNKYGLYNDELKFFESYLSNCRQCCSINGHTSTLKPILCGVPQGSILGPLLFIIYMNDLPACIWDGRVTMYPDDTSLSNKGKTIEDIEINLYLIFPESVVGYKSINLT